MPSVLTYEGSIVVPLSAEEAFDAYMDADHYHEWQRMLKRVLDVEGSTTTPGSTYVLDHGIVGKMRVDVLTVERPWLYRARQRGTGLDVVSTTRFIPAGSELTQVRLSMDLSVGRLQRLLRLPVGLGRWSIEDELNQFKKWVIRNHGQGGATS